MEMYMRLFAIGDLHLSTSVDKPMTIFGECWKNHEEKIFSNWNKVVEDEDIVFVVGDISWASNLKEAEQDLDKIYKSKGTKFFIKGNHDYWWTTATGLSKLYDESMVFMNTNYKVIGEYAICGTRGWNIPNDIKFDEKDNEIYKREAHRLKLSFESARKDGFRKYIVLMHYPPINKDLDETLFSDIIREFGPEHVIYGHLHGEESFDYGFQGLYKGTEYHLVSSDYLKFELKEIKQKPTVCVDIDGTIIDPYFFIPYLNNLNGVNIDKKNYNSIKWTDTYGDRFVSLYRNFDTIFTYVYEEAKLLPDVLETIEMLEHRGYNVYFVTARDTKIDSITKKWIEKNGMNPDRVISLGTKNKVNIAKKLGCDVFIEDDPGNIEQLLSAGFEVIALDTNYNKGVAGERLTRVSNWEEIMGIFDRKEM